MALSLVDFLCSSENCTQSSQIERIAFLFFQLASTYVRDIDVYSLGCILGAITKFSLFDHVVSSNLCTVLSYAIHVKRKRILQSFFLHELEHNKHTYINIYISIYSMHSVYKYGFCLKNACVREVTEEVKKRKA